MWYSVEALFETLIDDEADKGSLFDTIIFLIKANDNEEARVKAEKKAKEKETAYSNFLSEAVKWAFVRILEIQETMEEELYDGIEVFSRLSRKNAIREA